MIVKMVGMVASPTPTVPMASDSISVISSFLATRCERAAAVIQPAVPPPAMTTRVIGPSLITSYYLSLKSIAEFCAQLSRHMIIHLAQAASTLGGYMAQMGLIVGK